MFDRRYNTKRKTTIELSNEQYFYLKERALELQKQNHSASIASIIRGLIDKDMQHWDQRRVSKTEEST